MKRSFIQSIPVNILLVVLTFLGNWPKTLAQSRDYYQSSLAADKGHWKLTTNYATRSTVIRFYDRENQVIYEEILPGQYIKLTDRNIETINQTFTRLVENQLVLDKIKPITLPEENSSAAYQANATPRDHPEENASVVNTDKRIGITFFKILDQRAFKLMFKNPSEDNVHIHIKNEAGELVYKELVKNARAYNRRFDLSHLEDGIYTFEITNTKEKRIGRVRLNSLTGDMVEIFPNSIP
jgi:hypothetical protein